MILHIYIVTLLFVSISVLEDIILGDKKTNLSTLVRINIKAYVYNITLAGPYAFI